MTTSQMTNRDQWIEIGTVVAPQGLKGEVRVYATTDFPERFEVPGLRWLQRPQDPKPQVVELLRGRRIPGKNMYIVQLAGVGDRNHAEELRGSKLLVPKSDRPELAEDEYHVSDLIGLEVINQSTDETIGVVVDVFSAGNDLLAVEPPSPVSEAGQQQPKPQKNKRVLIPFVKEIVPVVDLESNRLEVNPPPGLLELSE